VNTRRFKPGYVVMRLRNDDKGMAGLQALIGVVITLAVIAILFQIVPMLGYKVESAVKVGANSQWNASVNSNLPTGYGFWADNASLISIVVLIALISIVIGYLVATGRVSFGGKE